MKVVRVQNPSDDRSGAEHCASPSVSCQPLAPGQVIPRKGSVRTFAGAGVTLDLGHGRKLELGPLSETQLSDHAAELTRGEIGVVGTPLIAKEPLSAFDFVVGRRTFSLDAARSTLAQLSVTGDTADLTMRQGKLRGTDVDGLVPGQTVRLTSTGAFHTSASGGELAPLPYVGSQRRDFGEIWPETGEKLQRGLGTMTARVPNTDRVLGGVRLLGHHVEVTIVDGVARTEVVEEFENQTEQILEGRFRFPVPSDASVSRLGLWVGDDLVEGEVVEAKRARSIYESIVDRPVPRDPALLEWVTAGEMSLTVFPILPKMSRRVLLAYDQVLSVEGGRFRYSYPLSLGEGRENAIADLRITVHVRDTQGDIGALHVPSHDARIGREGAWSSVYFAQRNAVAARDFVVVAERHGSTSAYVAADLPGWAEVASPGPVPTAPSAAQRLPTPGHFLLRASVDVPKDAARPQPLLADRAIVLDVSYSQSPATVRAQAALALAVLRELEPEEGLVLLACDSACSVHALPSGPLEVRLESTRQFLRDLAPGGASDLAGALVAGSMELGRLARGAGSKGRQLVLLSDGHASAGELSARSIARIASRYLTPENIDLRLVGVGRKLDRDQLEGLAVELDAALDHLPSAVDLEQRLFEVAIGLRQPVVRSARVSLPAGFELAHGARLPALRLGQEVLLTGVLRDRPAGEFVLSGRLAGADYRLATSLDVASPTAARNPFVAALFARQRIKLLLAAEGAAHDQAEIVRLSVNYRTMSPYTSFLVLENDEMFRRFGVERRSRAVEEQSTFPFGTPPQQDLGRPEDAMSFEQEQPEGKFESRLSSAGVPAPTRAPTPASAPPAPKAKKASSAGGAAESSPAKPTDDFDRYDESRGLGDDLPGAYVVRRYPPRPPRAHLAYSVADDAWRSWAPVELEKLRQALADAPESRSRMEEFVRRHLAQGRFLEAAQVARRFFELDPDYLLAQDLLAQAAVVAGDHELARRMLDVQVETNPRSTALHVQAAWAFESAGDSVRACAHLRALADLSPADSEAAQRASSCFVFLLGGPASPVASKTDAVIPQLRVTVECAAGTPAADCPAPVLVAPDGRVTSPWTPGPAVAGPTSVGLSKVRRGSYHVLLLGGAPGIHGRVHLVGRHEQTTLSFVAGGLRTVAQVDAAFY